MTRAWKLSLGLGLGALFLWLALRQVDMAAIIAAGRQASPGTLALAPLCLALGYACRIQRWRLMLREQNPALGLGTAAIPFVASIAVNNLAPFRMGDLLRCFAFSRWLNVAPGAVVASVLVERLLDMIALILALALALWFFSVSAQQIGFGAFSAIALALTGIIALVLLLNPAILSRIASGASAAVARVSVTAHHRMQALIDPLIAGLADLSRRHLLIRLVLWSLPVWFFEGATYLAVALSLPALTAPEAAWLAMPTGTLATLIPSTPGHIGTFDFFTQAATVAAGNPLIAATAFTLLVHLVLWLTTTVTGVLCLLFWIVTRDRRGRS